MQFTQRQDAYKGTSLGTRIWKNRMSYMLVVPAFVMTLIFCYWPMYGIILAFKEFRPKNGILGSAWANPWYKFFHMMFRDPDFFIAVRNTVTISFVKLVISTSSCILLALLLNEVRHKTFKRVVQTMSYLPHFLSWVIMGSILFTMFSSSFGAVTVALEKNFGVVYAPLSDPAQYRSILYISSVWKEVGFGSIIYLAAIAGVSPELYEAAIIDGANRFQRLWHITLTSIRSTIILLLILAVGGLMNANFDQIFNTYSPRVFPTGDVIDTWIYRHGIQQQAFSYSTAVGLFKQIINIILLLIVNQVAKFFGEEGVL